MSCSDGIKWASNINSISTRKELPISIIRSSFYHSLCLSLCAPRIAEVISYSRYFPFVFNLRSSPSLDCIHWLGERVDLISEKSAKSGEEEITKSMRCEIGGSNYAKKCSLTKRSILLPLYSFSPPLRLSGSPAFSVSVAIRTGENERVYVLRT